jgi:hypothetical protein
VTVIYVDPLYKTLLVKTGLVLVYSWSEMSRSNSVSPETPLLLLSPSAMATAEIPEVSMVEEEDASGVTFTPE